VYPKYAPIAALAIVKIKPIPLKTIPAIAKPRLEEFKLITPKINAITDIGNPQIGNSQARRLKMPKINDAMANPKLAFFCI